MLSFPLTDFDLTNVNSVQKRLSNSPSSLSMINWSIKIYSIHKPFAAAIVRMYFWTSLVWRRTYWCNMGSVNTSALCARMSMGLRTHYGFICISIQVSDDSFSILIKTWSRFLNKNIGLVRLILFQVSFFFFDQLL